MRLNDLNRSFVEIDCIENIVLKPIARITNLALEQIDRIRYVGFDRIDTNSKLLDRSLPSCPHLEREANLGKDRSIASVT